MRDAGGTPLMTLHPKRVLRAGVQALIRKASRNYIAGPALEDAMSVSRVLAARGYWATLGYWEVEEDHPEDVLRINLAACQKLAALDGENYLSVKAPALGNEPEMFRRLVDGSNNLGAPIHFDSLDINRAGASFDTIETCALTSSEAVGCTLPGRWRRSLEDAERAIALGLLVRVVKGQCPDPADSHRDAAAGYVEIIRMLAGRARRVRVATHNPALARQSLEILRDAGTPCELEWMYGLPIVGLAELAREFEVPVRVYVAFGHAYLPYAIGSLSRSPLSLLKLVREVARGDCLSSYRDLDGLTDHSQPG